MTDQDLEERFDRKWGTVDEIFAPSPTVFGNYDIKLDLSALLSPSYKRIDEKPLQQIGYDNLKKIVDKLAITNPDSIKRLIELVSQRLETDVNLYCLRINAQSPYDKRSRIEYEKRTIIPDKFLEYARNICKTLAPQA